MIRAITAKTAARAYQVLFWHLIEKGEPVISEDGAECRRIDTVICHITNPLENLERLVDISPLGPLAMEQYRKDFVDGVDPEDPRPMDFEYTYYNRLRVYGYPEYFEDQIEYIVDKLKLDDPFSRRAVAVLWEPWRDCSSSHPPCLNMVKCNISTDLKEVNMSCVFRSHALVGGWENNVYVLAYLLKKIAGDIGRDVGYLEIVSFDGHYNISDMDKVERLREML
jgi:thymidylate synthase (methanogen type)